MPTVAELRERAKGGPPPLPKAEEPVTLTEGQHLLSELNALSRHRQDLAIEVAARAAGESDAEPLKAGEKGPAAELETVDEQIEAKYAALREFQGVVGLTGMLTGDWQRWKDDHPPRPDNDSDDRIAAGYCNSTDLLLVLGKFVTSWDGEDLEPGAWDAYLGAQVAAADHPALARAVVEMHEARVRTLPKSSTASSSTPSSGTGSTSPTS